MEKLRVLCDMDGVIADLQPRWYEWINETFDDNITPEKITEWEVHRFCKAGLEIYEYLNLPGTFLFIEPIEGAIEGVNRIRKMGHEVIFCTSDTKSNPNCQSEKKEWLKHHFSWFKDEHIIFSHDKGNEKGDVLIDDREKWLVEFPKRSICFDAPYNWRYKGFRAKNWKEVVELVEYTGQNWTKIKEQYK